MEVPSNNNEIVAYMHCRMCIAELPRGVSPREWARLEFGWTMRGCQVWCARHGLNVINVDFQGHKHPSNATAKDEPFNADNSAIDFSEIDGEFGKKEGA